MGSLMFKELVRIRVFPLVSVVAGSMLLASCSSGVSRFDFPAFGLSDTDEGGGPTASLSNGSRLGQGSDSTLGYSGGSRLSDFADDGNTSVNAGGSTNYNSRNSYLPPQTAAPEVRSARYGVVDSKPLAPVGRPDGDRSGYDAQPMKPIREARRSFLPSEPSGYNYNSRKSTPARRAVRRSPQRPIARAAVQRKRQVSSKDQTVPVMTGDTLYSIGRRYNISVVKLMEINDLTDSNIAVGQQLTIPGSGVTAVARTAPAKQRRVIRATRSGTYTVRTGESFQAIASKLGVSAAALAEVNGITEPGTLRPGEVLILPAVRKTVTKTANLRPSVRKPQVRKTSDLKVRAVKTRTINLGSKKSKNTSVARKTTNRESEISAFRWPVRGRIIGKFGPRGDGTHNDGINLAVPNGTKVKAAEAGVVAYAGNELKGYGNLVLIRHAEDWVSAYAHNGKILVKRGDKITRGQVVARAGTSGSVEQPQVHFELRKASKPVDPISYMAGT